VLLTLMRRRLGRLGGRAIGDSIVRILVASAALAGAAYGTWWALDDAIGRSFGGQVVAVLSALLAGIAAYLIVCKALRVRELGALLALRRRLPQT
jgi:hypothetical protein